MNIQLDRNKNLPFYIQIRNLLRKQIQSGGLPAKRLPPVRKIAAELGVNPNTVLRAYYELSKEGIVAGNVGKGTFITTTPSELKRQNRSELLRKAIEHSLEEALSLEFTIEEYEEAVKKYIKEKQEFIRSVKLVFIECNIEQLTYFTEHLELDPHILRIPILLDDLRKQKKEMLHEIRRADIIVTSFYHLDEIREKFGSRNIPIIGINLEPEVTTLIEIAKIPPEYTVGIVTTSEQCKSEIKEILKASNIYFSRILETTSRNSNVVKRLVSKCRAILVSPRKKEIVEQCAKSDATVIEFAFIPDKTSINNLKVALLELKKSKI